MNRKWRGIISMAGLLAAILFLSSCIRLAGGAGYSYQGSNDEAPKSKSIGFDTANL